jgi:hypothetical protein
VVALGLPPLFAPRLLRKVWRSAASFCAGLTDAELSAAAVSEVVLAPVAGVLAFP